MKIHGTLKYNIPLVITREDMMKLDENLLSNHCDRILYIGSTIYGSDIIFSSLDELLQLEKVKDNCFRTLRIIGFSGKTRVLHITLGWLNEIRSGLRYPDVLVCKYNLSSANDERELKMSMNDFIVKTKVEYPRLEKYMRPIITFLLFLISLVGMYFLFSQWNIENMILWKFCGLLLLLYVLLYFLVNVVIWAISRFIEYLFPPIAFTWGIGEDYYTQRKDLRRQIFWTVLVGGLISLVIGIILNLSH